MVNVIDVRPDLRMVLDSGPGQAYLLRRGSEVVLVDTGIAGQGDAIAEALRDWGLDRESLTHVLLTHWHPDHAGSAAELAGWPGVQVWARRNDAPIVRGDSFGSLPSLTHNEEGLYAHLSGSIPDAPPSRVDRELGDDEVLDVIGARVISTPGHTDGSIALYFQQESVLFTGDVATEHDGQVISGRSTTTGRVHATPSVASPPSRSTPSVSATVALCVATTPPSCAPRPLPGRSRTPSADTGGGARTRPSPQRRTHPGRCAHPRCIPATSRPPAS